MTQVTVEPADVGRNCPYCRFPLKQETTAARCDACGALHHGDCWNDGGGCSVVGCSAPRNSLELATAVVLPSPTVPSPMPQASPPAPSAAPSNRGLLVGGVLGLLVVGAAVGGYALAHRSDDAPSQPPAAQTVTVTQPTTSNAAAAPTVDVGDPAADLERTAARELADVIDLSLEGRTAVREGRYADAIANRRQVLRVIAAIEPGSTRMAEAKRTLRRAMRASLAADEAYAAGSDPSVSNAQATDRKEAFVAVWNPIAAEHGLLQFAAGDI
jgi:hypothetical protein